MRREAVTARCRAAVAEYLADSAPEMVTLIRVMEVVDTAARACGLKRDRHSSLWDYARYVPAGYRSQWCKRPGDSGGFVYCVPPSGLPTGWVFFNPDDWTT